MKSIMVADIIGAMEQLAPPVLAEDWDNCGLQVGSALWPVKKVWVALDPLAEVIQAAVDRKVDMVVTHHPLLIRPLRNIDVETPAGRIIETALRARIALYAAHTNLDSAREGVNEVLARTIGLESLSTMIPHRPDMAASNESQRLGMGRIGQPGREMSLAELARDVKEKLQLGAVKVAGAPGLKVDRVAVCSGSGSGLLDAFLESTAQVYISGDMRYHDARKVEDAGRGMIDVGHFSSEHLIIDPLVVQLKKAASSFGWHVDIEACGLERDPFFYLTDSRAP